MVALPSSGLSTGSGRSPLVLRQAQDSGRGPSTLRRAQDSERNPRSYLALVEVEDRVFARSQARRRDSLPEHTRYVDTGCDIHPSCLSCPLVRCRYDEPGGARKIISRARDDTILRVRRDEKLTVEAIAQKVGVSRRTVFRVLARAREATC